MTGFDPYTWYTLTTLLQISNNTLTAGQDTQTAFDPNNPGAVYLAPVTLNPPPYSQLWQLLFVSDSSNAAYILRNRQLGADAYLTATWTTRKAEDGNYTTVPVLAPYLNTESLWEFGSWGSNDPNGAAFMYNLGNGSDWRMDSLTDPHLYGDFETEHGGQRWNATACETFAASDSTTFGATPTSALAVLAQVSTTIAASSSIMPYTAPEFTSVVMHSSTAASGQPTTSARQPSSTAAVSSSHSSGLSTSASIGVGVGIAALVFIIMAMVGLFLFRCYRQRKQTRQSTSQVRSELASQSDHSSAQFVLEPKGPMTGQVELDSHHYSEMPHWRSVDRAELGRGAVVHELQS